MIKRIATVALFLSFATVTAHAQVRQYAAKFVCGTASKAQVLSHNFAPGEYYTSINVHNPALAAGIEGRKKFAFADVNEQPGKISEWFPVTLKPDQAMQIDCGSIYKHLGLASGTFIDGFAVIQLPSAKRELDVVGVYTTSSSTGTLTMEIERVAGRITQ